VPLSGALCVDAATPFVAVDGHQRFSLSFVVGSDEICRLHEAPAPNVAGDAGHPFVRRKSPMFVQTRKYLSA